MSTIGEMCRVLAYLGEPLPVRNLLFDPDNSLVTQSHSPQMMNTFLNLAGFGLQAWDPGSLRPDDPFTYRATTLPSFDRNLRSLSAKLAPTCLVAHVRGVTYSEEAVVADTNLHPFRFPGARVVLAHNGHLRQFARMRYSLVEHVRPELAERIEGTTDSEWIYALILSQLDDPYGLPGDARARRGDGRRAPDSPGRSAQPTASTRPRLSTFASAPAGRSSRPASRSTTAGIRPRTSFSRRIFRSSASGTRSAGSTPSTTAAGR